MKREMEKDLSRSLESVVLGLNKRGARGAATTIRISSFSRLLIRSCCRRQYELTSPRRDQHYKVPGEFLYSICPCFILIHLLYSLISLLVSILSISNDIQLAIVVLQSLDSTSFVGTGT